jgi:hypothetical protein
MARLTDTSPEADRVWTELYRALTPGKKWLILGQAFQTGKVLHAAGVLQRTPRATEAEIRREWLAEYLGERAPLVTEGAKMDPAQQNLGVVREVVKALDGLGIAYALGGSMASSVHGIARYTQDADITVEPFAGREGQFAACFGPEYYVSLPAIVEAVRDRTSFNLINTREGFKVDVFIRKDVPFEQAAMQRRVAMALPDLPSQPISVLTAEDVILFKLQWYRLGGEASAQQWADVLGVLKVQAGRLDEDYLDRWAAELHVGDLLARARQESAG